MTLKELLKKHDISAKGLAVELGVSWPLVYKWMDGWCYPSFSVLVKLRDFFVRSKIKVDVIDLFN